MNSVFTKMERVTFAIAAVLLTSCHSQSRDNEAAERKDEVPRSFVFGLPEEETLIYRGCLRDDECVYVTNGCCPCTNPRAELAVHRDHAEEFKRILNCSHAIRICPTVANPTCKKGHISCDRGLCVYHLPPAEPYVKKLFNSG